MPKPLDDETAWSIYSHALTTVSSVVTTLALTWLLSLVAGAGAVVAAVAFPGSGGDIFAVVLGVLAGLAQLAGVVTVMVVVSSRASRVQTWREKRWKTS